MQVLYISLANTSLSLYTIYRFDSFEHFERFDPFDPRLWPISPFNRFEPFEPFKCFERFERFESVDHMWLCWPNYVRAAAAIILSRDTILSLKRLLPKVHGHCSDPYALQKFPVSAGRHLSEDSWCQGGGRKVCCALQLEHFVSSCCNLAHMLGLSSGHPLLENL